MCARDIQSFFLIFWNIIYLGGESINPTVLCVVYVRVLTFVLNTSSAIALLLFFFDKTKKMNLCCSVIAMAVVMTLFVSHCIASVVLHLSVHQRYDSSPDLPGAPLYTFRNRYVIYAAGTKNEGVELWTLDTTTMESAMLGDLNAGTRGSNPRLITPVGDKCVMFTADNGRIGTELWSIQLAAPGSNTPGGNISLSIDPDAIIFEPILVGDINPGRDGSAIAFLSPHGNGTVLFSATDKTSGTSLWRASCTPGSATMVNGICSGKCDAKITGITSCGPYIYFAARGSSASGTELWYSDGVSVTGFVDIATGSASSNPRNFACMNNTVYFAAWRSDTGGALFSAYGNSVRLVVDTTPALASDYAPENLRSPDNVRLFFSGFHPTLGYEPYFAAVDATPPGATLVKARFMQDINPDKDGSLPGNTGTGDWVLFGDWVIYSALSKPNRGRQMYATFASALNTPAINEINATNITFPNPTTVECTVFTTAWNMSLECKDTPAAIFSAMLNGTTINAITNSSDIFVRNPSPYRPCTFPLRVENRTEYTVRYNGSNSVQVNETYIDANNDVQWHWVDKTIVFEIRETTVVSTYLDRNVYPCLLNITLKGGSAADLPRRRPAPYPDTSFLYCEIANISASPTDIHVRNRTSTGAPADRLQLVFAARNDYNVPQIFMANKTDEIDIHDGRKVLPIDQAPHQDELRGGFGMCKPVADKHRLPYAGAAYPVTLGDYTFFRGSTGTVKHALMYIVHTSYTPPVLPCPLGQEPNVCSRCARPGDHLSCRGLSCGSDRIQNGCGECVMYNTPVEDGFYTQCKCHVDTSYTLATAGFGIYTFASIDLAIAKCSSKHIVLHTDAISTSSVKIVVASKSLRVSSVQDGAGAPYTLQVAWTFGPGAEDGVTLEYVLLSAVPGCPGGSILDGSLETGDFVLEHARVLVSADCAQSTSAGVAIDLEDPYSRAMVTRTTAVSIAPGTPVFSFDFPNCALSDPQHTHVNFTYNNVVSLGAMLTVSGARSAWITDNECPNCGAALGAGQAVLDVKGCLTSGVFPEWFEIARNVLNTPTGPAPFASSIALQHLPRHNIYGNIVSGQHTGIAMALFPSEPFRGPPPENQPWMYTTDTSPIASARAIAYENHRVDGIVFDIVHNSPSGIGVCNEWCGMDEVLDLGTELYFDKPYRYIDGKKVPGQDDVLAIPAIPAIPTSGNITGPPPPPPDCSTEYVTATLHVYIYHQENGYIGIQYPSTYISTMAISSISDSLASVSPVITPLTQTACFPNTMTESPVCRHDYVFNISTLCTVNEITGDFVGAMTVVVNNRARLVYNTPYVSVEWYRNPELEKRLYGAVATLYTDVDLTVPYNKTTTVLVEGDRLFLKLVAGTIIPERPDDRTVNYEIEIDKVALCFPNATFVAAQTAWIALTDREMTPVIPYVPWNPSGSGCWQLGRRMDGPYLIYDRENPPTPLLNASVYNPTVYRNATHPISQHNLAFTVITTEDTHVDADITVVYRVRKRQFLGPIYYTFPRWENVTYVNQVSFRRKCPTTEHTITKDTGLRGDDDVVYQCELVPPPPKEKPVDITLYVVIVATIVLSLLICITCIFDEFRRSAVPKPYVILSKDGSGNSVARKQN